MERERNDETLIWTITSNLTSSVASVNDLFLPSRVCFTMLFDFHHYYF